MLQVKGKIIVPKLMGHKYLWVYWVKVKCKGSCLESRLHDNACSTDFTFPLARWTPMQPATIDPTLDLCTRYPLRLGGPRQCGIRSLPNTSTHGQHWKSSPIPSDLESNALSTRPHAPMGQLCPFTERENEIF